MKIALEVVQHAIGERIKYLLAHTNLSARKFSRAIGVPDNNTQNYIGPKAALPKADYLERILRHFQSINPWWLLAGEGPAFFDEGEGPQAIYQSVKKNFGNIVGSITGGNHTFNTLADCAKENEHLRTQVALLHSQLADKQEIIDLLKGKLPQSV